MKLTNDCFVIVIHTKTATERYYRDHSGWLKVSTRGRIFRATAEQVLNHVLPVLAGSKPTLTITVEHRNPPLQNSCPSLPARPGRAAKQVFNSTTRRGGNTVHLIRHPQAGDK